jgi:hypothetical protein
MTVIVPRRTTFRGKPGWPKVAPHDTRHDLAAQPGKMRGTGLVARKTVPAFVHESLLPSPDAGVADPHFASDLIRRYAIGGETTMRARHASAANSGLRQSTRDESGPPGSIQSRSLGASTRLASSRGSGNPSWTLQSDFIRGSFHHCVKSMLVCVDGPYKVQSSALLRFTRTFKRNRGIIMSTAMTERTSPAHRYMTRKFSWTPVGISVVLLAISLSALSRPSGTLLY